MKIKSTFFVIVLLAILISACGANTPTAGPTTNEPVMAQPTIEQPVEAQPTSEPTTIMEAPTEAPVTSGDPVWDRVKAAGKIVIGTSADYQPFEYYDSNYEIIGFDAALAREIGARLGLQVELVDIAFEGLPATLQIGQIDAAIAAISVTPERQSIMDFTNVYYSGQDEILARQGSGIPQIVSAAQLAQYRVAAQRGSIYASWVQKTLVDPGLMPATNLLVYAKAEDAVRDLKENRNDIVILDKLAADEYLLGSDVVSVGQNLNRQLFAIALPKGATVLQSELNSALTTLQNDGTVAQLTDTYLNIQLPVSPPAALPTATPIPGPAPTPAGCFDAMQFERDVQVPDGTEMNPNQDFVKVWRIRNTGTCAWNTGYALVFVQGDRMDGNQSNVTSNVNPGNIFDMNVILRAPKHPGNYTGVWQMVNPNGTPFGERIWVKIKVPGAVQPTVAPPMPTAVQPVQPTLEPQVQIKQLKASADTVQQGELLIVSWSFSGEGLASARLTRTNPDGSITQLFGGADVDYKGQYEDLMMSPGTYSYTLTVSSEFGGTVVKTVVVNVIAN